mmetsp:Transcript_37187/g.87955  ORF Transcript_37187/g.87955 Transcript_37187/m.87955 type:complete len:127 (-) Transcript_37187:45-425(-)
MRRASSEQFTAADAEQTPAQRPRRAARPEGIRVRIRRWFIPVVGFIAIVLCIRNYAAIAAFGEEVRLWEDQMRGGRNNVLRKTKGPLPNPFLRLMPFQLEDEYVLTIMVLLISVAIPLSFLVFCLF